MDQEMVDASREALENSAIALKAAFKAATTQAQKDAIEQQSDLINAQIEQIDVADLLTAATLVGQAATDLQTLVSSATLAPISAALGGVVNAVNNLSDVRSDIHKQDALPKSEPPATAPAAPPAATAGIPQTSTATDFPTLQPEYTSLFGMCAVRPERQKNIDYYVNSVVAGKTQYAAAVAGTSIPWYFVGIVHGMEGGFNFTRHLHNGDPLTARTVHVPAGRPPPPAMPPFTWLASAQDALKGRGFDAIATWDVAQMLFQFERYNGMGYRPFREPSPCLWSFSNLFLKGKYVGDGVYDPNAPSEQCGAGVILKAGTARGAFA